MKNIGNNQMFAKSYRIYLEDTDAGGIVYHANHLKLYERCRRDWLRELGMTSYFYQAHSADNINDMGQNSDSSDIQFVVSQANVSFYQPILLDSLVTVSIHNATIKGASLILDQRISLDDNISDSNKITTLLSQAMITLVCVKTDTGDKNDKGQTPSPKKVRPTRLPKEFLALLG